MDHTTRMNAPSPQPTPPQLAPHERVLLMVRRQALLLELAAVEDCLGMLRSAEPRKERRNQRERDRVQQCVEAVSTQT